jgi:hypothetical protein
LKLLKDKTHTYIEGKVWTEKIVSKDSWFSDIIIYIGKGSENRRFSDMDNPTCQKVMGNGNICGKRAVDFVNNIWCCKRHTRIQVRENRNIRRTDREIPVFTYPPNTEFGSLPDHIPTNDHLTSLGNYFNFILVGVLVSEEIPLAMINKPVTAYNIANFIAETIEFFQSRPDVFTMTGTLENYKINRITYNTFRGIYMVYVNL